MVGPNDVKHPVVEALPDRVTLDPPFAVSATASSGLPVSFSVVSGPATVFGSTVTLTGVAGTVTLRAEQPGNTDYYPAPPVEQSFEVLGAPQSIDFQVIADKLTTDLPFGLTATASSGLPVSFAIVSGPATVVGSTLTLDGAVGTVTVRASQPGNATYLAAPSIEQSFMVLGAPQSIDFQAIADKLTTDLPFGLTATASSGLPVSFAIVSALTLTGAVGTVTVRASQPGNATYLAAPDVEQSFDVDLFELTDDGPSEAPTLLLFPNPVGSLLHVRLENLPFGNGSLLLRNSSGQLVKTQPLPPGSSSATLDLGGLPGGAYSLTCLHGTQQVTVRVVKAGE
jgi:hypothetical protein